MKKIQLGILATILTSSLMLTACGIEVSSGDDTTTDEMHAKIANTRWQMTEIMNQTTSGSTPTSIWG